MNSSIIRTKIEVHAEEAKRLLLQDPLVAEFQHHLNSINALQVDLQKAVEAEKPAPSAGTDTVTDSAREIKVSTRTRRKK